MIVNKNEFFTILSRHGANMTFAKAMLDGTVPSEVRYQFDSTYEWDLTIPVVQEVLALFVYLKMVPQAASDEIIALAQPTPLDIREKRYDLRGISGEVVKWIETNIQPPGTEYTIESEPLVEDGQPVILQKGPALVETGMVSTTGVLPAPEVK